MCGVPEVKEAVDVPTLRLAYLPINIMHSACPIASLPAIATLMLRSHSRMMQPKHRLERRILRRPKMPLIRRNATHCKMDPPMCILDIGDAEFIEAFRDGKAIGYLMARAGPSTSVIIEELVILGGCIAGISGPAEGRWVFVPLSKC